MISQVTKEGVISRGTSSEDDTRFISCTVLRQGVPDWSERGRLASGYQ